MFTKINPTSWSIKCITAPTFRNRITGKMAVEFFRSTFNATKGFSYPKNLIEKYKTELDIPIIHVWQEDNGFQKSQILNKAILASTTDYLIFTDGDCIPRKDFVETHLNNRETGRVLSGGYFMLPMNISKLISKEDVLSQKCFDVNWLTQNGLKKSFKNNKLTAKDFKAKLLNFLTPTKPSWNGHNASGWKKDLVKINGFNQEMQYGGQDRELGERLENLGIKGKQIRYSAICVHLDHARGYVNPETWAKNNAIRMTKKHLFILLDLQRAYF